MDKAYFKAEFENVTKDIDTPVTLGYAWSEYQDKVEPYLPLMAHWKTEKKHTDEEIRLLLGVGSKVWQVLIKFDVIRDYIRQNGQFLESAVEKQFFEAKNNNQNSAKFHEMAFKLVHTKYGERKDVNYNIPNQIDINVKDSRLDKQDIKKITDGEKSKK